MEDQTQLEKITENLRAALEDLLALVKKTEQARDTIVAEAVHENQAKKITILKNKIERL